MKTDHAAHEQRYRQLRGESATGWDGADDLADHVAELSFYDQCPTVPKSGRLLELGCGAGDIVLRYAARGFDVSGVDLSETATRGESTSALVADAARSVR